MLRSLSSVQIAYAAAAARNLPPTATNHVSCIRHILLSVLQQLAA